MNSSYLQLQDGSIPSSPSTARPVPFAALQPRIADVETLKPSGPRALRSASGVEDFVRPQDFELQAFPDKLEEFPSFIGPWLPPDARMLLQKSKKWQLSEKQAVKLMDIVAERAIEHYELPKGKYAAITLTGRIAELTDTKLELLKRLQGRSYSEQLFLWKIGSKSFSGRI